MFKSSSRVAACAAVFLLSACGGGGGGVASTPPPPPPPQLTYDSFPLTESGTFQSIAGHLYYADQPDISNTRLVDIGISGQPSGVTISYDDTNDTYKVADGTRSASFSAASVKSGSGMDTYTAQSGVVSNELQLFSNVRSGASQAGAPIKLSYLSFGKWTYSDSNSGDRRVTYLLFGYPTASSDMPRTGSASYDAIVSGTSLTPCFACEGTSFDGTATLTANFAVGSVDTALNLTNIGTFQGSGTITGSQFLGEFTGTFGAPGTALQDASFKGGFFGPSAAEMGYTFSLRRHVLDPYAGATVAYDTWFVGSAVGKKTGN